MCRVWVSEFAGVGKAQEVLEHVEACQIMICVRCLFMLWRWLAQSPHRICVPRRVASKTLEQDPVSLASLFEEVCIHRLPFSSNTENCVCICAFPWWIKMLGEPRLSFAMPRRDGLSAIQASSPSLPPPRPILILHRLFSPRRFVPSHRFRSVPFFTLHCDTLKASPPLVHPTWP